MFRIESYLTPIILHHLEKYVKNIRPQDAQLSLWNGEWAFQNLDLKLEVLEEELNMPFSFLSGHIHELVIRVPWTKLGSEPINITINTIEFVLKLREVSPDGNPQNRERSRKKPKPEDFQAPPGYMASLVNKIANNISVQCHNIIFKYLEEDIVLSMNIQLLSVDSADEEWNPAFIDVSPIKVFLRKIVNITDLTICLDKRNETGKIEVCQEPILYRCSMQVRLFRRYNISTAHKSSVLRMDVHTKSIDLNISSLQFPMVLRLMKLILALKDGNLRQKNARQEAEQEPENAEEGDSVFSWVWNLLPSLLPGEDAIEDDQESHGHVLHCGAYADEVKMTFKNQEIISDSFVHTTKKIKYNPILTVKLSGSYCDTIIMGKHWFSTTGGVSSIKIFPTGDCVCGQKHFLQEFLSTDDVQDMHYMEGSIYDPKTEENLGIHRSYRMFWDFYYLKHTSVSLLNKTPALAFDLVHEVEIPEDIARSSDLGSDLEFSDLSEKCLQRVFFGPFTIRYGQGVAHLIETFQGYIKSYNYAPYLEEKPRLSFSQLSPASTDDYDALMSEIPLQVYEVSFTDATLEIYTGDHEKTGHRSVRKKNSRDSLHPRAIEPSCRFNTESLEGRMETPMYPNRLIHTTCQLPNPPDNLFDACYTKFFLDMKNSGCFLRKENNLLTIPDISGSYSYLLLPELWDNERVSRMKMHLTIPKIEMSFNRLQVQHLKESFMELMYNSGSEYSGDMFDPNLPMIQTTLDGMTMAVNKTKHTSIFTGSLQTVFGVVIIPSASYESVIFRQNTREHFFEVTLQMNQTTMVYPPILRFQIGEVSLNLDPLLMDFLMYDFTPEKTSQEGKFRGSLASVSLDIGKKIIPDKLSKRPSKKTLESVHSSSEKNTAVVFSRRDDLPKKQKSLTESYSMWKNLAIAGRMKSWRIIIPEGSLQCRKREESFEEVLKRSKNLQAVILNLPQLQIQSSGSKITSDGGRLDFPLILPWEKSKDSFPWSVTLSDFSCDIVESGKKWICLESVTTNISLAITYKAEIVEKTDVPFAAIFHIDITPLVIKMSVDQLQLLLSTLRRIQSLPWIASLLVERDDLEVTSLEIAHRSTSPDSDVDLKDFFGMKTSSTHEMSSDVTEVIREARSPAKGSLWLQWTLTKITANFYSSTPTGVRQKLVLEFEDIISSIDLRDIYVKLKAKIGYFACNSFLMDNPGVWRQNEMMGVCGRTPETSDPNYTFLDVTVTKAETSNVHNKWGASKKNRNLNESLTEVMVNMQQIDFKIDPNFLQSFVEFLKIFLNSQAVSREKEIMKMRKKDVKITSVADLPLIYFNCKGFRVLVPVEDNNGSYNVCILKVGSIGVASTVENPLTRTPVRSDIYTKAAQLRILSIPGSKIEDRQYELTLKNITIGTGKWQEVVGLMEGTADGSIVYNDNPAFVWNNQSSKTSIDINAIFKDFTCSLIFAPCIVFNNILVCGQGLEFNALTDLSIHLNTDQLSMALSLWSKIQSFQQILNSTKRKCLQKDKKSPVFRKIPPRFKRIPEKTEYDVKDSGFESIDIEKKSSVEGNQERFLKEAEVPYDISFVGGVFTVNLYHHESCLQATLCIFQPNLFLTQGVYEKTTQMSVFDMNVILSNIPGKDQEKTEDVILSTSKGELNPMGIASPILRVKLHRSIANQSNLDIQLGRHMKITTSDQTLRIVFEWKRILEQTIPGDLLRDREAESSVRKPANIIKNVQMSILGCEHLTLKLDHMEIVTKTDDRQVKMILRDFTTDVGMLERPLGAQIDVTLGLLAVITHQYTFIHPTSITLSGSIVRESWQKTPLCTFRVSSKYLHVDIGPETLLTFQAIHTSILRLCYEFGALSRESLKGFEEESCEKSQEPSQHLIPIKIPKMKDSEDTKVHEEHYSDDLRAGAFQFIELKSDKSLPLPYQIQIINLDVGIICWRYPQPRAISKVDVFPVPFPTLSPIKIRCTMEYYAEAHGTFLHYCDFSLSESEVKTVEMPKKKITSSVWRVVMSSPTVSVDGSFFEEDISSTEESDSLVNPDPCIYNIDDILQRVETFKSSGNVDVFTLHPKILVACLRINSFFSPSLIPNLRGCCEIAEIEVNIMNHIPDRPVTIPKIIREFNPVGGITQCHAAGVMKISNVKVHGNIFDECTLSVEVEMGVELAVLDYGNLLNYPVLESVRISGGIDKSSDSVAINVVSDPIRVRLGPAVGHTITTTHSLWTQSLQKSPDPTEMIIVTRFLICNSTNLPLIFGQMDTDESILLPPKICHLYVFRSVKKDQKLKLSIANDPLNCSSVACCVNKEGKQFIKLNNGQMIHVIVEKISSTQRKITLKGQIEVFNMSIHSFTLLFKSYDQVMEVSVRGKKSSSLLHHSHSSSELPESLKIRFNEGGWSGEIPLTKHPERKHPWLVKIPLKSTYMSFWLKIFREDNYPMLVIAIWPLFVVKSNLGISSVVYEAKCDKSFEIPGRGATTELNLPGTHEDEHTLQFNTKFLSPLGEDRRDVLLSYRAIDKNVIFPETTQSIEKILEMLENCLNEMKTQWPGVREEEQLIDRKVKNQGATVPIYKFSKNHPISNSLMLEISPWCIFINSTEFDVRITSQDEKLSTVVGSNELTMPFGTPGPLQLALSIETNWIPLPLVNFSNPDKKNLNLPESGTLPMEVPHENGVSRLQLTSAQDNQVRNVILSSHFIISNFTKHNLKIWAFAIQNQDRKILIKPNNMCSLGNYNLLIQGGDSRRGIALTTFYDLSQKRKKPSKNYNYFLTIRYSVEEEFSCPIYLNDVINCKSLSLPYETTYIPLRISLIKQQDQSFITIHEDEPMMWIENFTDFNFYVAQADSASASRPAVAVRECFDQHFSWYQIVPVGTRIPYTAPLVDQAFPDNNITDFALIFALVTAGTTIRWSIPLPINEKKDVFLTIPLCGDLKISIDNRWKSTRIFIDYISGNLEFSVRDIRSRLVDPTREPPPDNTASIPALIDDILVKRRRQKIREEEEQPKINIAFNCLIRELMLVLYCDHEDQNITKKELVAISMDHMVLSFCRNLFMPRMKILIGNIQVDNLLHYSGKYDFPVILCSETVQNPMEEMLSPNSLEAYLRTCQQMRNICDVEIEFYEKEFEMKSIHVQMTPFKAFIEDTYINVLLDFLVECHPTNLVYVKHSETAREICPRGVIVLPNKIIEQANRLARPLQLQVLKIDMIHMLLSLHTCVHFYIALDHSPLTFSAFEKRNINTQMLRLGYSLGMHYLSGAIFGAGWVVGSLEILGSPSGLARSVSTGLWDFVSLPVEGLLRGPWDFLMGITLGSASLVRNITAGTLNSVTKLATSVARNLDRLTLDEEHLQRTDALRRYRPQGLTQGFAQGLTDFGISLLGAIGGIARHTLEAKSASQVFAGVGKGLMGVILKPISGAAELVALTGQGVLHSVGYNALPSCRTHRGSADAHATSTKILWKILPTGFANDPPLFSVYVTLIRGSHDLTASLMTLTSKCLSFLNVEQEELVQVMTLEKITVEIVENDSTAMILKILSGKNSNTSEDTAVNQYAVLNRIRDYVQKSREQMTSFSDQRNHQSIEEEKEDTDADTEQSLSFYIHAPLGHHLMDYIHFLQNSHA